MPFAYMLTQRARGGCKMQNHKEPRGVMVMASATLVFAICGGRRQDVADSVGRRSSRAHFAPMSAAAIPSMVKQPAPFRLLLVRHGESVNNALMKRPDMTMERWEAERQADPDLSVLGRKQAEALAAFLAGDMHSSARLADVKPISALYVSPVKRALQTLLPTANCLGLSPRVWTDCFEVGGIYHQNSTRDFGLSREQMHSMFPSYTLPADVTSNGWYKLAGKETADHALGRVWGTAEKLRKMARAPNRPEGTVLLLTHHDHLNLLLQALLQDPTTDFGHRNTAMSCIDISADGVARVLFLDCIDHLTEANAATSKL